MDMSVRIYDTNENNYLYIQIEEATIRDNGQPYAKFATDLTVNTKDIAYAKQIFEAKITKNLKT